LPCDSLLLSCFFTVLSPLLGVSWKCGYARLLLKARPKAVHASPRLVIPWLAAG
jgi:hypothetical protein